MGYGKCSNQLNCPTVLRGGCLPKPLSMEILELPIWLTISLVFQSRKLRSILHPFLPLPNPDWSPSLLGCTSHSLYVSFLTCLYPSYGARYLPPHRSVWLLHSPHDPSITPLWSLVAQVRFSSQRTRLFSNWFSPSSLDLPSLTWTGLHPSHCQALHTCLPSHSLASFVWILIPSSHSVCHPWGQQLCLPHLQLYLLEHGIYSPNTRWLNKYTADAVRM